MAEKIFGIPIREALTIGGLLLAIGIAWGTSQVSIASNSNAAQNNSKKIDRVEQKLSRKVDNVKRELKDEIKENRQILIELLQRSRKRDK